VFAKEGSYWMDLKPADNHRIVSQVNLKLDKAGKVTGTLTRTHSGYGSVHIRREFNEYASKKEYLDKLKANVHDYEIASYERTVDSVDLSKPITEKFEIEFEAADPNAPQFLFNPKELSGQSSENPFKTETRMFPVDYGVPIDRNLIMTLEYPETYEVVSVPDKLGIALPNGGGRCLYAVQTDGKKLSINMRTTISKAVFAAEEYPFLREMYARLLVALNSEIIFKKKT
jgi:hypothetical protein